jgi:hypothetical protein
MPSSTHDDQSLTPEQYLQKHQIAYYMRDVVGLLLKARDDHPLNFIADYFSEVLGGTHASVGHQQGGLQLFVKRIVYLRAGEYTGDVAAGLAQACAQATEPALTLWRGGDGLDADGCHQGAADQAGNRRQGSLGRLDRWFRCPCSGPLAWSGLDWLWQGCCGGDRRFGRRTGFEKLLEETEH